MQCAEQTEFALQLINLNGQIQRKLAGALTVHGLGVSEFLVLLQLHGAPDKHMRRVDLAEAVGMTASGITRLLNPMEKTGLITKQASARDARVSLVGLSKAGARVLADVETPVNDAAKSMLKPLNKQHLADFRRLVDTLR